MTDKQFADMFAISQLSPGPNVLIVTLIGYSVAGVAGALVATFAMCGPTAVLAYYVSRLLARSSHSRWPAIIQAALVPLSIGLMGASGLILALDLGPDLGRRPGHGRRCRCLRLCHGSIRSGCCWPGGFGFCWRYLTKIGRQDRSDGHQAITRTVMGGQASCTGERVRDE